jgi:hypothetical protein
VNPHSLVTGVTAARQKDKVLVKVIGVVSVITFIYYSLILLTRISKTTLATGQLQAFVLLEQWIRSALTAWPFSCLTFASR